MEKERRTSKNKPHPVSADSNGAGLEEYQSQEQDVNTENQDRFASEIFPRTVTGEKHGIEWNWNEKDSKKARIEKEKFEQHESGFSETDVEMEQSFVSLSESFATKDNNSKNDESIVHTTLPLKKWPLETVQEAEKKDIDAAAALVALLSSAPNATISRDLSTSSEPNFVEDPFTDKSLTFSAAQIASLEVTMESGDEDAPREVSESFEYEEKSCTVLNKNILKDTKQKKAWMRSRLTFVGGVQCGKTSTVNSFKGRLPLQSDCKSKTCIHISDLEVQQVGNYEDSNGMQSTSSHFLKSGKGKNIQETLNSSNGKASSVNPSLQCAEKKDIDSESLNNERVHFKIFDYGGQRVFGGIQYLLSSKHGIFIVVFNMMDILDSNSRSDALEDIKYWLSFIKSDLCEKESGNGSTNVSMQCPPVILIGTHYDEYLDPKRKTVETSNELEAINQALMKHLPLGVLLCANSDDKVYTIYNKDQDLCFWPIDNTNSKDPNILKLRQTLVHSAKFDMEQKVPVSTIQAMGKLTALSKSRPIIPIVSDDNDEVSVAQVLSEFGAFDDLCYESSITKIDICKSFLKKCHSFGQILYFHEICDLENYCILDPQWLLDKITYILRDQRTYRFEKDFDAMELGNGTSWKRLFNSGVVDEEILQIFWKEDAAYIPFLLCLLCRTGILGKLRGKVSSQKLYSIPLLTTIISRDALDISIPVVEDFLKSSLQESKKCEVQICDSSFLITSFYCQILNLLFDSDHAILSELLPCACNFKIGPSTCSIVLDARANALVLHAKSDEDMGTLANYVICACKHVNQVFYGGRIKFLYPTAVATTFISFFRSQFDMCLIKNPPTVESESVQNFIRMFGVVHEQIAKSIAEQLIATDPFLTPETLLTLYEDDSNTFKMVLLPTLGLSSDDFGRKLLDCLDSCVEKQTHFSSYKQNISKQLVQCRPSPTKKSRYDGRLIRSNTSSSSGRVEKDSEGAENVNLLQLENFLLSSGKINKNYAKIMAEELIANDPYLNEDALLTLYQDNKATFETSFLPDLGLSNKIREGLLRSHLQEVIQSDAFVLAFCSLDSQNMREERHAISKMLRKVNYSVKFTDSLANTFEEINGGNNYGILHLGVHDSVLEDMNNHVCLYSDTLKESEFKCIFLNACNSKAIIGDTLKNSLKSHCIISWVSEEVDDQAATIFAEGFYHYLCKDKERKNIHDFEKAFENAKRCLTLRNFALVSKGDTEGLRPKESNTTGRAILTAAGIPNFSNGARAITSVSAATFASTESTQINGNDGLLNKSGIHNLDRPNQDAGTNSTSHELTSSDESTASDIDALKPKFQGHESQSKNMIEKNAESLNRNDNFQTPNHLVSTSKSHNNEYCGQRFRFIFTCCNYKVEYESGCKFMENYRKENKTAKRFVKTNECTRTKKYCDTCKMFVCDKSQYDGKTCWQIHRCNQNYIHEVQVQHKAIPSHCHVKRGNYNSRAYPGTMWMQYPHNQQFRPNMPCNSNVTYPISHQPSHRPVVRGTVPTVPQGENTTNENQTNIQPLPDAEENNLCRESSQENDGKKQVRDADMNMNSLPGIDSQQSDSIDNELVRYHSGEFGISLSDY
ncbi:hypothetical protein CTEN210_18357 [Chaetoceros tenuissimus]|uniref:CHAT domain-containing protein n=1 Tax=Chaetoceros tenuissimus TaxID=426638 RepID=A0AAD3DEL6_9STRA|nr:hypothetical protein CTEN210_18357 [Chaetoceros tenuissimus]